MFWSDEFAQTVKKRNLPFEWVDDMKTPSGRVHVGSLRGVIIHDLIYKSLVKLGVKANYSYVFNDCDPMDSFPIYLPETYREHMGKPLYKIPSPKPGFDSYAQYFAKEFIDVFESLDCHPKIIWSHELYEKGAMDELIKLCLDKTAEIKKIYEGTHKKNLGVWYPFQVICPKCGKLGSTKATGWDGEKVAFECLPQLVAWAQGCGHKGAVSPYKGTGKLLWKIDWAAHWKAIGVTVEWAGKDHMSKGGSYEITSAICKDVIKYPPPLAKLYEHFLLGGRKMSSSKGVGASSKEMADSLPAQLLRFLMVRTHYRQAINFNPQGDTVLDLFDEYDEFCNHFYDEKKKDDDYARIWELSQIDEPPKQKPIFPRFRDVANFLQSPSVDIYQKFPNIDKQILEERIKYAKIWLKTYAPEDEKFEIKDSSAEIDDEQKKYLQELIKLVAQKDWQPEDLQQEMYELSKRMNIQPKKAFQSIYLTLFGKTFGPKAAWLILDNQQTIIKKFDEVLNQKPAESNSQTNTPITNSATANINSLIKTKYPDIRFGCVVIKNVSIKKEASELEKLKKEVLVFLKDLTTEKINSFSSIKAYRDLFKSFGVDWHSRRPSPDALLRRIALGKGLYKINTLVDAYNLAVLQTKIGLGAFDLDKLSLPITLRYAAQGESIVMLGEDKPESIKSGEIVYSDKDRIITLDLNYRDADYTKVTVNTKNIILFADGAPGISRKEVETGLSKGIELITKFCGGIVEPVEIIE